MESAGSTTMRAIEIRAPGEPDVLQPVRVPMPRPGADDVLIRVAAAGVNRPDVLQRRGHYAVPADASPLPGLEVAGVVVDVGGNVREFAVGDEVMALTHGGGYAEYALAHRHCCLPKPRELTFTEAAGVPETGFTVVFNVFMRAKLNAGETLLVHGGSSGIGSMAIPLAKASGCRVLTTAGSTAKCRFCEHMGADLAVNYRESSWSDACRDYLGDARVDVVLDMVGGDYLQANLDLLALNGRYALIAFLAGAKTTIDLRPLLTKQLTLTGSTLRPQPLETKREIRDAVRRILLPLLESGKVRPIVDKTFPLADAAQAHRHMEAGSHMGKIILQIDDG